MPKKTGFALKPYAHDSEKAREFGARGAKRGRWVKDADRFDAADIARRIMKWKDE